MTPCRLQAKVSLSVKTRSLLLGSATFLTILPMSSPAQDAFAKPERPGFNSFGVVGLIDMPSADMAPDAELSTSVSHMAGTTRSTLSFQLLPRLTGSFRYTAINNLVIPGSAVYTGVGTYYDRSFDVRYQLLEESKYLPALSVGLQDFIGTGLYGGEYVVATKEVLPGLKVTGGLGWGRLGSYGAIGSTGTRPTVAIGQGGKPSVNQWFRGDVAPFGGIEFAANDRLSFKAEYSSDAYTLETGSGFLNRKTPWNVGIDYRFKSGNQLSIYSLYGTEIGAQLTFHTNPKYKPSTGGNSEAPLPIRPRSAASIQDLGWTTDSVQTTNIRSRLKIALAREQLVYEAVELSANRAVLRMQNNRYASEPQALGRAARAMSRILPDSIETLTIVPMVKGIATSAVTFKRSDLERLEHAPATELLKHTVVADGAGVAPAPEAGLNRRFNWALGPYMSLSFFDPNNPVRANFGAQLSASYLVTPNLELSGSVSQKLAGNLGQTITSTSALPPVRTDLPNYLNEDGPVIDYLTVAHFGRPGANLYSRVTAGYLEKMYAGVSGEVLWKPVDSRLALGVEANYVVNRDYDQLFGVQNYKTITGHVSGYYDFGNGFHGRVDVGRYLAGDYGATVTLDREFANGWRVGAYATLTDVPFSAFGEGSFDKGMHFTVPIGWVLGTETRRSAAVAIQSLTRDGGARLNVQDRLYERVRDYHRPSLSNEWGRVWR